MILCFNLLSRNLLWMNLEESWKVYDDPYIIWRVWFGTSQTWGTLGLLWVAEVKNHFTKMPFSVYAVSV